MLDFFRLKLANALEIKPLFTHSYSRLCDYVFGTVLLWRDMWPVEFAVYEEMLFLRMQISGSGKPDIRKVYMLPVADDLDHALAILETYQSGPKQFHNVPYGELEILKQRYPDISVEAIDIGGDYLYDAGSMATLTGRKLHGQRNHLNYFERTWSYRLENITGSNVKDVKEFIERKAVSGSSALFQEGNNKTLEALDNMDIYDFSSLVLYAEDKVIGFTLGTLVGDTLYVTIEQADRDYRGVYPKLASAFVSSHLDKGAVYVNREDDIGDEGLRKSKMAWNPCQIVERFAVTVN